MSTHSRVLLLASTSKRRHELLGRLGVSFTVIDPQVEEPEPQPGVEAREYALAMAQLKAEAALATLRKHDCPHLSGATLIDVLSSDTTVALDSQILGKPTDRADALRILRALSGSTHRVISSYSLRTYRFPGLELVEALDDAAETRIRFRTLTEAEIVEYVDSGESFGKAGAYAVQEHGDRFVEELDGDFTTVVGLPLAPVAQWLRERGYPVPAANLLKQRLDRRIPGR